MPSQRANKSGVFVADAPEGYAALVVYISSRRVLRLEIANDYYSAKWLAWLRRFHQQHEKGALKVV